MSDISEALSKEKAAGAWGAAEAVATVTTDAAAAAAAAIAAAAAAEALPSSASMTKPKAGLFDVDDGGTAVVEEGSGNCC